MTKPQSHHKKWGCKPGGYDALNTSRHFFADNPYDIPCLQQDSFSHVPGWLVPYRTRVSSVDALDDGAIHFFLEDYRFESVWNRPTRALNVFGPYQAVLTPDFSLYRDWPLAIQLWNTYRSRWCGAYWQSEGIRVIPTIAWGSAKSYDFCFLGVPTGSFVAISTVGVQLEDPLEYHLFLEGFTEMVRRLDPAVVLCYGPAPSACSQLVEVVYYETRWRGIRQARKNGRQRRQNQPQLPPPVNFQFQERNNGR